ncbi:HIT family protein [Nonomuraea wenchangensis]|uniref:HIT family protein n=1 Tax=Nonomuraea wenchangensis TaxID=568860 RepID=UPI0037BAAA3D
MLEATRRDPWVGAPAPDSATDLYRPRKRPASAGNPTQVSRPCGVPGRAWETLLKTTLAPEGVNVKHITGEAAGQGVLHYHVHVVPRWRGDGLRLTWSSPLASSRELEQVLKRVTGGG